MAIRRSTSPVPPGVGKTYLACALADAACRQGFTALDAPQPQVAETPEEAGPFDGYPCPMCRQGHLHVIGGLAPQRHPKRGDPST